MRKLMEKIRKVMKPKSIIVINLHDFKHSKNEIFREKRYLKARVENKPVELIEVSVIKM